MIINNEESQAGDKTGWREGSGKSTGFENVKNIIADKLHRAAEVIGEDAESHDGQSHRAQYEKHASEWLDHSAEYIREFDYKQTDEKLRECIRQHPGRSLMIAGGVGLLIGAILRRR